MNKKIVLSGSICGLVVLLWLFSEFVLSYRKIVGINCSLQMIKNTSFSTFGIRWIFQHEHNNTFISINDEINEGQNNKEPVYVFSTESFWTKEMTGDSNVKYLEYNLLKHKAEWRRVFDKHPWLLDFIQKVLSDGRTQDFLKQNYEIHDANGRLFLVRTTLPYIKHLLMENRFDEALDYSMKYLPAAEN